ncbi:tRNA synthetases class I-domain-containing protein [Achaetomium macrosporum]|uniref:tRNA synthetases class I-domain-containing protein n=1 Tax=Achaetomium macrosporum TaxID=79813 RepID=A0AAN7CCG2_9PEZI|nr:tRNA synthetases class I-domain-containing protein [Achaetomium macrosporum]
MAVWVVKAADKAILKDLRPTGRRLLVESQVAHVDKFCWRSDTQLIRRAVSLWFIKEKRFANWISNAPDWNVSEIATGEPQFPWVSDDYEEIVCVGSEPHDDIHRDKVDGITIPSKKRKDVLRRVGGIFDYCQGACPIPQLIIPLKIQKGSRDPCFLRTSSPKVFDQTRGWFYTLTVLGNKLFDTSPFKDVIVNGIVLAKDGRKTSNCLKNHPDPSAILDRYGSDALRLYLINSQSGVKEIVARVLLPLWNRYRFYYEQTLFLLRFMEQEMRGYCLYTVVPPLLQVIDNLANSYIRFNRRRLEGLAGLGVDDTTAALNNLLQVLFTLIRALGPFTPFITEHIYQLLWPQLVEATAQFKGARSVHFLPFPTVQKALIDEVIERQVSRRNLSLKTPLISLVVIPDEHILEDPNVRDIVLADDEWRYSILLEARVDRPPLDKKLKKGDQLREYQRTQKMTLDGIVLAEGDLTLVRVIGKGVSSEADGPLAPQWEPAFADDMIVLLDTAPHLGLFEETLVRELINQLQRLRKKAGLASTEKVHRRYRVVSDPNEVRVGPVVAAHQDVIVAALRGKVKGAQEAREAGADS